MSSESSTAPAMAAGTAPAVAAGSGAAAAGGLADAWWRDAVVYQVYVRSFADANGDGTGDLEGVRSRLDYLEALGVDALWFTPWYVSPLADGGYDVADYRAIDPAFGGLEEAEALIADAAARGIRTIVDVVPNHVSDRHPWFEAALAAGAGQRGARPILVPRPGAARRASCRRPTGCRASAARPGRASSSATAGPASGTCTCSRASSPTSTGTTPTFAPSTRTCCASGSIAASPASASTRPPSS